MVMADRDVVMAKVATIDRCLARIAEIQVAGQRPPLDVEDITVLNLQRAVQATVDLAGHLVSDWQLGLPSSLKENFRLLEHRGLGQNLSAKLQAMVGFRNIAVHDYQTIDVAILRSIVDHDLDDLRAFCRFAMAALGRTPSAT